MASPTRFACAGILACLAVILGGLLSGVAAGAAAGRLEQLSLEVLGLEIFIGLGAAALAFAAPVAPGARLGLAAGRLSVAQVALLALGTLGLSYGIDEILRLSELREGTVLQELDQQLAATRGRAPSLALAAFALVVAAPLGEELLCRGLLQRGLEARLGAAPAILLASVFFAAMHLEPTHALAVLPLGLYLGAAAWLAASIRASIACHLVNNGVAVGVVAFGVPPPGDSWGLWTLPGGFVLAALALGWVWWRAGSPPPLRWPEPRAPLPGEAPEGPELSG